MILATTLLGIDARVICVSAARRAGPGGLSIEGLAQAAEREARVRVASALAHADHAPADDIRVTCDAGGLRIDGTALDLAIALEVVTCGAHQSAAAIAELSLAGDVRPVRGVLPALEALAPHADVVFVAPENAAEAALVPGIRAVAVRSLKAALDVLAGDEDRGLPPPPPGRSAPAYPDMRDIVDLPLARRALEIAAAGPHNLLFIGRPGAGKTMSARRLPGILPPMTQAEALDVTRVHSVAGLNVGGGLITARPFRAPHHSTTPVGLVGGGANGARPGEASLATHGVLFLDELPEFARASLEVLREPLATGEVTLCRASGTVRFPARCIVVASMSPCACGQAPDPRCRCSAADVARYSARVSPILDLFDLRVHLARSDAAAISGAQQGEDSGRIRARVECARDRSLPTLGAAAHEHLRRALSQTPGQFKALSRASRVAATIARLSDHDTAMSTDAEEAVAFTSQHP